MKTQKKTTEQKMALENLGPFSNSLNLSV